LINPDDGWSGRAKCPLGVHFELFSGDEGNIAACV
jgi:hypothetical protein